MNCTILSVPQDALRKALSYLNAKELANLAFVSKYFHELSDEIAKDILMEIRKASFPMSVSQSGQLQIPYSNMKRLLHRLTSTQVYTVGGAFNSDQVTCYLPKSHSWHMSSEMIRERDNFQAVAVRGYIVSVSGESDDATSSAEIFSPLENAWSALPVLSKKIRGMACVTMGDKVVAVGGQNVDQGENVSSVQILDLKLSQAPSSLQQAKSQGLKWVTNEEVLMQSRYAHAAAWFEDELWVAGGTTNSEAYSTSVETLCWKNGSFKSGRVMPSMCNARRCFQLLVVKGKLYAIGGDEESSIECYNPDTNEWSIVTNFPSLKKNFSSTTDGENIYIFGGQDKRRQFLSSWECFDVLAEQWTVTKGKMPGSGSPGFSHGCAIAMNFENMSW